MSQDSNHFKKRDTTIEQNNTYILPIVCIPFVFDKTLQLLERDYNLPSTKSLGRIPFTS